MGNLFIAGAVTSESEPPTPDYVDVGAPYFYTDDLFFSNIIQDKLEADKFYDTAVNLHETGALLTDSKGITPDDESTPSDYPGNQY